MSEPEQVVSHFASDTAEAEEYRQILADHDIPVTLGEESENGIPLLVAEDLLDAAHQVIGDYEDELNEEDEEEDDEDNVDDDEDEDEDEDDDEDDEEV